MKAILVIDIADDVAEKYDVLTVDYTLCGDNAKAYDWLDYVTDVKLKALPQKKHDGLVFKSDGTAFTKEMEIGWNAYRDAILGKEERTNGLKPLPMDKSHGYYGCPSCRHIVSSVQNYCENCGQKLDWKGIGETE